ncbi:hypothetical protein [Chryseobacterium sp. A321]
MESGQKRFQDQNLQLQEFLHQVDVECPKCGKMATAIRDEEKKMATLRCSHCGLLKTKSMEVKIMGKTALYKVAAHEYFEVNLWYRTPFKDYQIVAYNLAHLLYLEQYIGAKLREHKDREHFTLLEKLPKFYHEAKHRDALLKKIAQLKKK